MGKKISFAQTYQGLSNQPPWRKQPGQTTDCLNKTLDIAVGSRTRNGTTYVAAIGGTKIPTAADPEDVYITSFQNDIILIQDGSLYVIDGTTGAEVTVVNEAGNGYLEGMDRSTCRTTVLGNSIVILNRSVVAEVEASDDYTVSGTVDNFTDLPNTATLNEIYKVNFNDGGVPSGYYKRVSNGRAGLEWQRTFAPNDTDAIPVGSTLPHRLIRTPADPSGPSAAYYTFEEIDWTPRRSGDNASNPPLPIFGATLDAVAAHSGRLFLPGSGYVCSTSSMDRELLYVNDIDATNDVASNPISQPLNANTLGGILFAQSIAGDLAILCEKGQLRFTSGQEQLTSINGTDVGIGDTTTQAVHPAFAQTSIVLVNEMNDLQEFAPTQYGTLATAGNLNAHALKILQGLTPLQLFRFGSTLFILTTDGKVAVHEKTIDGNNLVQTGWSYYNFNTTEEGTDNKVAYMDEWGDTLRLVVKTANGYELWNYQHKAEAAPAGYAAAPCLDRRVYVSGSYNSHTDRTVFSYSNADAYTVVFVSGSTPKSMTPVAYDSTTVEVAGRVTAEVCIGQSYLDFDEYSELYAGPSSAKPTVSEATVFYYLSSGFDVVTSRKGDLSGTTERRKTVAALAVGADYASDTGIRSGCKTVNILQDGRNTIIRIEHRGALPLTVSAVEFTIV